MRAATQYTEPRLVKGTKPVNIPKGSTLDKEWSKNIWYINYSYNGQQVRVKGDLNRIKDPKEKQFKAEVLLQSIKNDLAAGFNPQQPEAYIEHLSKQQITLAEAVDNYLADVRRYCRPKSVQSYRSKLRFLVDANPNKLLQDLTAKHIQSFIKDKIESTEPAVMHMGNKVINLGKAKPWTNDTVKAGRAVFRAFFNWSIGEGYITANPVLKVELKKIRSEVAAPDRNVPFTINDAHAVLNYLDLHDKFTAFICRLIYSTCLRPAEICGLRLKDIDMEAKTMTVPLIFMKNTKRTKADSVDIEPNLYKELEKLLASDYPKDWYLTSNTANIIGPDKIRPDKAYKELVKALKVLGLDGKGYTLYGFKHFSNIQRLKNGWTLAEIMKGNRHSSIVMTEKYLRDLTKETDIRNKAVPAI